MNMPDLLPTLSAAQSQVHGGVSNPTDRRGTHTHAVNQSLEGRTSQVSVAILDPWLLC